MAFSLSPNVDFNLHRFTVSSNITITPTPQISQISHAINSIPKLSINTSSINLLSLSLPHSTFMPLPIEGIKVHDMSGLKMSFDDIVKISTPDIPKGLSDLKNSFDKNFPQLHPAPSKPECKQICETTIHHNSQLKCGVPDAITGLMVQEPDATKCVIDLNKAKIECLSKCELVK